jgi:hypothetical protein
MQFNFYDHTKIVLSMDGNIVTVIDRRNALKTWSLEALLRPITETDPKEKRRMEGLVHKIEYIV